MITIWDINPNHASTQYGETTDIEGTDRGPGKDSPAAISNPSAEPDVVQGLYGNRQTGLRRGRCERLRHSGQEAVGFARGAALGADPQGSPALARIRGDLGRGGRRTLQPCCP